MDNILALLEQPPQEVEEKKEKKKKKKKMSAKKLKKLQVKQQEEARVQALIAKQKYLEQTKERVQREWATNKAKSEVYMAEQNRRIEHFKYTFEKLHEIEEKWSEFNLEKRKEQEWQRFLNCNRLPDPTILPQMNAYKFIWTEVEDDASIGYCLTKAHEVIQLLNGLDEVINDPWPGCPQSLLNGWKMSRNEMRNLLQNQIDKTTYRLFRRIETDMQPIDVTTSQYYCESDYFTMHLWAELITPIPSSRATEIRHPLKVSFQPADLTVTVPVTLLDVHKVIRVMLVNYDHWSDRCRSFYCPSPPFYHAKDLLQLTIEELDIRMEIVTHREDLEVFTKKKIASIPPQPTVSQELFAWDGEPQRILSDEVAFREAEQEEMWKDQARMKLNEFEINLRERAFLGGIIILEVLHQPPQPKYLRPKYDITLLVEPPMLQPVDFYIKYPPPRPVHECWNMYEEEEGEQDEEECEIDEEALEEEYNVMLVNQKKKLITVQLKLPDTVYWFETPMVANWDKSEDYWTCEHVHDIEFDEEEQRMTFKTGVLGLIGLHVSRFCNLPYEDWRLEGIGPEKVSFFLQGAKIALYFTIQNDQVCLESVDGFPTPPMPGLLNTFLSPIKLVQLLRKYGIYVFPEADAACYITDLTPKHIVTEKYVYQIWGLFSGSFCFQFSKFNRDRGRQSSVFQAREVYDDFETSFCLIKTSSSDACILDITEESDTYSSDTAPGIEPCADLYNLIMRNCTHEARRKAEATSFILIQTIRDLLGFIRPLSFS